MSDDLKVYTIPEVAEILKVGRHKVEGLIRGGSLKAKLLGNAYRISHANLVAFINDDGKAKTTPMDREKRRELAALN